MAIYKPLFILHTSNRTFLYQSEHKETGENIVVKSVKPEFATPQNYQYLKNEYNLLMRLNSDLVRKAIGWDTDEQVILLEYVPFPSLSELLAHKQRFFYKEFLLLAIEITKAIGYVHLQQIIHKDINPNNILVDMKNLKIKLIDFGISTRYTKEKTYFDAVKNIEGTIKYISPEQTGRMNRNVDYRSDYYALGITFYQMLLGEVPFNYEEGLHILHAHITQQIPSLHEQDISIPLPLSQIVEKLTAKNAEERYQSHQGILADLQKCLDNIESLHHYHVEVGKEDYSDRFEIPQKLYGREEEYESLLAVFEEVIISGKSHLLTVSGYSGVGKTALINEIQKPITEKRGFFVAGKYNDFDKNIPFSAINAAFSELIHLLLAENEDKIHVYRREIEKKVAENAKILVNLIPDLELLIGKQPPLHEILPVELQARMLVGMKRLISVFAKEQHPFVLFLDDVQYIDTASLALIKDLILDESVEYMLFILSYRSNEVASQHALQEMLDEILTKRIIIPLEMRPLSIESVKQLIADTLHTTPENVEEIAWLIHQKTEGNPFFISELLKNLNSKKVISYDVDIHAWKWDIEVIRNTELATNVIELLLEKIKQLSEKEQLLLQTASCLGNEFDADVLKHLTLIDAIQIEEYLASLVNLGFLTFHKEQLRFVHDRIKQAAYTLLDEEEKMQIHYLAGFHLLPLLDTKPEMLFDITEHFNQSIDLISDEITLFQVAHLNWKSAQKAQKATAYRASLDFVQKALILFEEDIWFRQYEMAYGLHFMAVELSIVCGEFDNAKAIIQHTLRHLRFPLQKAKILRLQCILQTIISDFQAALETGKQALHYLGLNVPTQNIEEAIQREIRSIFQKIYGKNVAELAYLPENENEEIQTKASIFESMGAPAYYVDKELFNYITLKPLNLLLDSGNHADAGYTYFAFGTFAVMVLENYTLGYEFGKLAWELGLRYDNKTSLTKTANIYGNFILPWKKPFRVCEKYLQKGMRLGIESGDILFGSYCALNYLYMTFLMGKPITEQESIYYTISTYIEKTNIPDSIGASAYYPYLFANLNGQTLMPLSFDISEEDKEVDMQEACKIPTIHFILHLQKSFIFSVYGFYKEARQEALRAKKYADVSVGNCYNLWYRFLLSYSLLKQYEEISERQLREYLVEVEEHQRYLRVWTKNSPQNATHLYFLIEALKARALHKPYQNVLLYYQKALKAARKSGHTHWEALIHEEYGKFWFKNKEKDYGYMHIRKAYTYYQTWGCTTKINLMRKKYGDIISPISHQTMEANTTSTTSVLANPTITLTSTTLSLNQVVDSLAITRIAQALSSERQLGDLLNTLLRVIIENSGAQKGVVVQRDKDHYFVCATIVHDVICLTLEGDLALDTQGHLLPISAIHYTIRTQKELILSNPIDTKFFSKDAYIQQVKPKSILVIPLLNKGEIVAILYLENDITVDAFKTSQVGLLKVISTQMAISIESVLLYENLENKVKERTLQIEQAHHILEEKNRDITASINAAKRIQDALLPFDIRVAKTLDEYFVLYKPRDIVSGDFYWFEDMGDKVVVIVADCTGHGVPGAFVSMIGYNLLSEIVRVQKILAPDQILNELKARILYAFKQEDSATNEGMDIVVLTLTKNHRGGFSTMEYAGAMNPFFYVMNDEFVEIKASKNPIGGTHKTKDELYKLHTIEIQQEAMVYLCTDGYQDQFGGKECRKFMTSNLKKLLHSIHTRSVEEQERILNTTIINWMAESDESQLDDITIMGIRLKN